MHVRSSWLLPYPPGTVGAAHALHSVQLAQLMHTSESVTVLPPIPYQPAYEVSPDDELQTAQALADTMLQISKTVVQGGGQALRSVHAKAHGILRGTLQVLALPPELAQGLFAQAAVYPVALRFSSTPGDLLDDAVSTPRGVAIKVMQVAGERLDPDDGLQEQDFLMVNAPVFGASNAKQFLAALKVVAATTDRAPRAKKLLSMALRGVETLVEQTGAESQALKALGGHPATHPLGETYFTQVPLLHGRYMAKYTLVPVSGELRALQDERLKLAGQPQALRDAMNRFCAAHGGVWELRAQLCVDVQRMPIEDASVPWPEALSPYVPVARLTVESQTAWGDAMAAADDAQLSFSPWRGLAAHRPIGSIMRVRRLAYARSSAFRHRYNGIPD